MHQPDFEQFLRVLRRQGRPDHLPVYEHLASPGFVARATGTAFDRLSPADDEYWRIYARFWMDLDLDCIPIEVAPHFPRPKAEHGQGGHASEAQAVIASRADFERYPWPSEEAPLNLRPFEIAATCLRDGAKLVAGVCMGPYEWASTLMGTMGLSYALVDDPELVEMVFDKLGRLIVAANRQLAAMDFVGALRQGDDLGFRSSTFLSPEDLRRLVFPIYRRMTDVAHAAGKPFILHSCGQLKDVYDDLIDTCRIDAKHSFEEAILPVEQFKRLYGHRVTSLGGLDVDVICRSEPDELRRYTRRKVEQCFHDGHWALGTGNSLTDYMPVENYRIVLEEGRKVAGR